MQRSHSWYVPDTVPGTESRGEESDGVPPCSVPLPVSGWDHKLRDVTLQITTGQSDMCWNQMSTSVNKTQRRCTCLAWFMGRDAESCEWGSVSGAEVCAHVTEHINWKAKVALLIAPNWKQLTWMSSYGRMERVTSDVFIQWNIILLSKWMNPRDTQPHEWPIELCWVVMYGCKS